MAPLLLTSKSMHAFRRTFKWIFSHKLISFILIGSFIASALFLRNWHVKAAGLVSKPLERGPIIDAVYGIGTVIANHSFFVRGGQVGHLDRLYVEEGLYVKKGQPLAMIDGITTSAPFSGTVTYCPYKEGELVFTQTIVLSLVDMADRYLTVSLEQQGALRVHAKQVVHVSFDSIRNESYAGVVRSVYSNGPDFLARIDVPNLPLRVLPGMTGDVAITVTEKKDVLLIPVAAIEDHAVWKIREKGPPVRVEVETGIVDRDMAELIKGNLTAGDRLVIHVRGSS